jgi:hypothetical protein
MKPKEAHHGELEWMQIKKEAILDGKASLLLLD